MKLLSLNPRFYSAGGPDIRDAETGESIPPREKIGMSFDCPCGCGIRTSVQFENPLDGGAVYNPKRPAWKRTGESFGSMTLSPSILSSEEKGGCGWHGWVRNGEVIPCG